MEVVDEISDIRAPRASGPAVADGASAPAHSTLVGTARTEFQDCTSLAAHDRHCRLPPIIRVAGVAGTRTAHRGRRHTLERAVEHLPDRRERDRRALPDAVKAILATPEQVEALREKVEPAHEYLRRHPDSRSFFDRLQRIVEETMAPMPKIGAA
jgi:hypothetical protein